MPDVAETVDFAQLREDTHARLRELERRRRELSFDAIVRHEPKAAAELAEVEAAIADAEVEVTRIGFAAAEHERREVVRVEVKEYERRRAALVEAQELAKERAAAAARFDKAAAALAEAVSDWSAACGGMYALLRQAGEDAGAAVAQPAGHFVEAALSLALAEHGRSVPRDLFHRLAYMPADRRRRLADSDPVSQIGVAGYIERLDASRAAEVQS